jgi:hypothetical protein
MYYRQRNIGKFIGKGEITMATSLAEIRARLQQQDTKTQGTGDKGIYAHWNIPEGATTTIRFLPDSDPKNSFFWVERAMIKLPFAGIKGQPESKPTWIQVPCMEMWNETCPILTEVRPWFKDESLKEMGRKYWKKRSYVFQGFVRKDPLGEETPENPIRRFIISPSIFGLVKSALMDAEMEEMPTDYERGLDFQVTKTTKGGYADYSTSKWSRKESALTTDELAAIEKYGLFDLNSFLPKKPGDVELKVIKEMFEASVDGQPYDMERWGQYYKPAGASSGYNASATSAASSVVVDDAEPEAQVSVAPPFTPNASVATPSEAPKPSGQKAEDILAMIRSRQKKQ